MTFRPYLLSLFILVSASLLTSCGKEISREDFETLLTSQTWAVKDISLVYYNSDGSVDYLRSQSYTSDYTSHRFQFHTDGKILVTKELEMWNGTWTITQDKKQKHSFLNIEFTDTTWNDYFKAKWQLTNTENEDTPDIARMHFSGLSNLANTLALGAIK